MGGRLPFPLNGLQSLLGCVPREGGGDIRGRGVEGPGSRERLRHHAFPPLVFPIAFGRFIRRGLHLSTRYRSGRAP